MSLRATSIVLLLSAAACRQSSPAGPWLTAPDAAAHASHFPIGVGDAHGPAAGQGSANCNGCHVDRATGQPTASFAAFSCTACHVQTFSGSWHDDTGGALVALHGARGVPGVDPANGAACVGCHRDGVAVDHAKIFPRPHGNAAGTIVAGCADCHVDATSRKILGCAGCHAAQAPVAAAHALVPDFLATDADAPHTASARCVRCHADDTVPVRVATHGPTFSIASGAHAATPAAVAAAGGTWCLACHDTLRAPPAKPFAADFTAVDCAGCHLAVGGGASVMHDSVTSLATIHVSVSGFPTAQADLGAACRTCHPDGGAGAPANHPQLFARGTGTKHATVSCSQCHTRPAVVGQPDATAFACAACHNGTPTLAATMAAKHDPSGNAFGATVALVHTSQSATTPVDLTVSQNCLRCHADPETLLLASHPTGDSGFGRQPHVDAGCLTCHSAMRTDLKPWGVNFGAATGCATCHPNGLPN